MLVKMNYRRINKMKNKKKLKGKDLINIGIYAAIYCVIMTAVEMYGI